MTVLHACGEFAPYELEFLVVLMSAFSVVWGVLMMWWHR